MNTVKNWKIKQGYTLRFIGELIGCSAGMVDRICNDGQKPSEEISKRIKEIVRLENLISGNPRDRIILKYEMAQLTGLSVEEIEEGKKKGEAQLTREAQKTAPKKPKNLRLIKLDTLKEIRDNGFKSAYRVGVAYDADSVNAEIARKEFNIQRKAEKWALKNS